MQVQILRVLPKRRVPGCPIWPLALWFHSAVGQHGTLSRCRQEFESPWNYCPYRRVSNFLFCFAEEKRGGFESHNRSGQPIWCSGSINNTV